MYDLIHILFERLEMWNLELPDALHRLEECRIRAESARELQILSQLLQGTQHPCPIEPLPLTVLAKAHRRSLAAGGVLHRPPIEPLWPKPQFPAICADIMDRQPVDRATAPAW